MENAIAENTQEQKLTTILTSAALMFWAVSLFLPTFIVESRAETWLGLSTLLFGLLFGWAVKGWAVYANLFFGYVALRLYARKRPSISVFVMLLLAATLPYFSGVIRDEGSGAILPVVSWGWGAVLWIFSIIILAVAAAVRGEVFSRLGVKVVVIALVAVILPITLVHNRQWLDANEQEREIFLPEGIAFTRANFCGVPLTWPTEPVIPPGTIVALDIPPEFNSQTSTRPHLWLPTLLNYQQDGFSWITYPGVTSGSVKIREPAKSNLPVLRVKPTDDGADLRLYKEDSNQVLYEQPLKFVYQGGKPTMFCPMSTQNGWTHLKKGYDKALLHALGQDELKQPKEKLKSEVARISCDLGSENIDGIDGLRTWDGRQAILNPESIRTRPGFCSESYIGLVYLSTMLPTNPSDLSAVVEIYDRKTLRPLAVFNDGRVCPVWPNCREASKDIIKGIRISDETVSIETTIGDFSAKQWRDNGNKAAIANR